MNISKIEKGREREETSLYKIINNNNKYVLKLYNKEANFNKAINAYKNIDEYYMPNIININKNNKSVLMEYYDSNDLNLYNKNNFKNFIDSWFNITNNISDKNIEQNNYNHQKNVEYFKESTVNSLENSHEHYINNVRNIYEKIKNYDNFYTSYFHIDSHLGNYIFNEDCTIKKVLDWEFADISICSRELAKLYVKILIPLNNLVNYNVFNITEERNNLDYNKNLFKDFIKVYQIRSTAKLQEKGAVQERIKSMYENENKNYLKFMEEKSKYFLNNKNILNNNF